jgi:hypothetical protein
MPGPEPGPEPEPQPEPQPEPATWREPDFVAKGRDLLRRIVVAMLVKLSGSGSGSGSGSATTAARRRTLG